MNTIRVILVTAFVTACGTDPVDSVPTLTADGNGVTIQKGEKGDRGERGEKGDTGAVGPSGRDGVDGKDPKDGKDGKDGVGTIGATGAAGVAGAAGKDGQNAPLPLNSEVWQDPITSKEWLYIDGGKFSWAQTDGICDSWRLPSAAEVTAAVRHGIARALTFPSPAAEESVWTDGDRPPWEQVAVRIIATDALTAVPWNASRGISLLRVYCVKN